MRQQRPERPAGSRRLWPHTSGQAGLKEGPVHPLADNRVPGRVQRFGCEEVKHRDLVGRYGKKVNCVPRSSFQKHLSRHITKAMLLIYTAVQASAPLPICSWLPQSHFLLPLTIPIALCLLLNSFLYLPHSQHFLSSGSRPYFCICPSHTSPTTLLHTLLFSPSSHLSTGFSNSFEHLASNLSSSTTKRSGEQRKIGGQDGHITTQVR